MRQHRRTVAINLIPNTHVITQHTDILHPRPPPDRAIPADNRALHPRMLLHLAALQEDAALQSHPISDHHVRANDYIGSDFAVLANLRGRVNEHVAAVYVRLGSGCQLCAVFLRQGAKVQAGAAQEVFGLSNVHPEAL